MSELPPLNASRLSFRSEVRYVDQEFVTEQRSGSFVERRTYFIQVPYIYFVPELNGTAPEGTDP